MAPKPKRPPKTAEEKALERRQQTALDKEIEEQEERFSLFSRKQLGRVSLLSGAPKTPQQAAGKATSGGRMFGGSPMSNASPAATPNVSRTQQRR